MQNIQLFFLITIFLTLQAGKISGKALQTQNLFKANDPLNYPNECTELMQEKALNYISKKNPELSQVKECKFGLENSFYFLELVMTSEDNSETCKVKVVENFNVFWRVKATNPNLKMDPATAQFVNKEKTKEIYNKVCEKVEVEETQKVQINENPQINEDVIQLQHQDSLRIELPTQNFAKKGNRDVSESSEEEELDLLLQNDCSHSDRQELINYLPILVTQGHINMIALWTENIVECEKLENRFDSVIQINDEQCYLNFEVNKERNLLESKDSKYNSEQRKDCLLKYK